MNTTLQISAERKVNVPARGHAVLLVDNPHRVTKAEFRVFDRDGNLVETVPCSVQYKREFTREDKN